MKYFRIIAFVLISFIITINYSCTEEADFVIGDKTDQAFIQNVVLRDSTLKSVVVSTVVPVISKDLVTDVEKLANESAPLIITVTVKKGTDITKLNISCTLSSQSKYASVSPIMGHIVNCSDPLTYTVTSQSGKNVKIYTILVVVQP